MPKRVRIESGNRVHFITFSVYKHIPVFKNAVFVKEFLKDLQFYVNKVNCKLHAFVIMPDHVHLLIEIESNRYLSNLIRDIKKYFSYQAKNFLLEKTRFDIDSFMRGRDFQFWESRFDEVTIISEKMFLVKLNYIHNNPVKGGLVEKAADYPYSSAKQYMVDS